ncbi:TetR/AcrR family transcriptional regulator [Bosea sp. (in: a-proteobacteria)]|jgi:TetR/AcrR family transcriptional repressor of nem operon|uniref:TetR/AcrR family transcriptional regulator n=1 Tax=Bosea sp. (in: a-proteobacteria) TaxID=1871050 RepID=UPI0035628307
MARPREFDEAEALDAAIQCFWSRGYEATSVRDLAASMGITGASLYNAFGDKRSLYERALALYVDTSVADRILRCEGQGPRQAIEGFFAEILERSLGDPQRRGCMLVNAALDVLPQDPRFQGIVAGVLRQIESFFLRAVEAGQIEGSITRSVPAADIAHHLLGVLMGVRVLARVRPERALLEGIVRTAFAIFDRVEDGPGRVAS